MVQWYLHIYNVEYFCDDADEEFAGFVLYCIYEMQCVVHVYFSKTFNFYNNINRATLSRESPHPPKLIDI